MKQKKNNNESYKVMRKKVFMNYIVVLHGESSE